MRSKRTMVRYALGLAIGGLTVTSTAVQPLTAQAQPAQDGDGEATVGNVIFIHPDGTGVNHWGAGRIYWNGPDAVSEWDQLPEMAVYRGHMSDRLTGTSNGGATTHAFGYKVEGGGSYGKDGDGDAARDILALSGYGGSILREAANEGHPVGVVNDGDAAEPGTGAFLAEVGNRDESNEIVRQIIDGRPGLEGEEQPVVALNGGEAFFLPQGTPQCTTEVRPDCAVHVDPVTGDGPAREDGRNLIQEAINDGWTVVRTRAEFEALRASLVNDTSRAPNVLGLFAADDIFNDVPEEALIAAGLVDPSLNENDKHGNLILWGSQPGTLGYNPPRADEMTEVALTILERRSNQVGKPFMLVTEVESTDNFGNNNNAIGTLTAIDDAFGVIGAARAYQARDPQTLILTAADSDAGGMQIISPPPTDDAGNVTSVNGNPIGEDAQAVDVPVDGIRGRETAPFVAAPDATGEELDFTVAWIGTPDVSGGIVSRAQGLNADLLRTQFSGRFDNTDMYRHMYVTLFGELLPSAVGKTAPQRPAPAANSASATGQQAVLPSSGGASQMLGMWMGTAGLFAATGALLRRRIKLQEQREHK